MTCAEPAHIAPPIVQKRCRCSVGSSRRYQPQSGEELNQKAQDYCFEALHKMYFCDAWRQESMLDALDSDLTLPPKTGLLAQDQHKDFDVVAVSDAEN